MPRSQKKKSTNDDDSGIGNVEKQTEQLRQEGTIWHAALSGDEEIFLRLVDEFGEKWLKALYATALLLNIIVKLLLQYCAKKVISSIIYDTKRLRNIHFHLKLYTLSHNSETTQFLSTSHNIIYILTLPAADSLHTTMPRSQKKKSTNDDDSRISNVEKQTEQLRQEGTIWHAAWHGDEDFFLRLVDEFGEKCLKERDSVGATPLHILCLQDHSELAMKIMRRFPERASDVYEGKKYRGENCLHLAIVQRNMDLAKYLVEACGTELFKQEAVGEFFLPEAEGQLTVYYGGYPLSFAVASGQYNMVEYFVKKGANIKQKDTAQGNTAMHISILYELPKMYDLLKRLWKEQEYSGVFDEQLNKDEQSSLTYAAAEGKEIMFDYVMKGQKQIQWQYGPITCAVYPLKDFDVLYTKPGDRYGALEYLVKNEHLDLISSKHVLDLIEKKWNCFAERVFYARFKRTVLFIFAIFVTSMLPRLDIDGATFCDKCLSSGALAQILRVGCECLALRLSTLNMLDKITEIRLDGLVTHFTATGCGVFKNIVSALSILTVFTLCGLLTFSPLLPDEKDAILAGLNIVAWCKLIWFLQIMSAETGVFVIILRAMLTHDLKPFSTVSCVLVGGFSMAFHLLGDSGDGNLGTQVVSMVATILGDFDVSSYQSKRFPRLATGLALVYIFLLSLVLVNMLIAKMGDTYANVAEQAEKRWNLERARLVIDIERSMSGQEKLRFGEKSKRYWIVGIDAAKPNDRYIQVEEYDKAWGIGSKD